jgi:TonB family protein
MKETSRKLTISGLLLASAVLLGSSASHAQEVSKRRLLVRAAPEYPALARTMALQGIVKVEALVAPDGTVKNAEIKGGHPVLAQAALNAVRRWKWESAAHESHEVVEVKFSPE